MSAWKWNRSYDKDENLDWLIIRDGPIVKYFSSDILEEDLKALEDMKYQIIDLSTASWTLGNAHKKIRKGFGFPDYYGENRAAFEDCLDDMFDKGCRGLVIALRHFDEFYYQNKDFSESILDGIANIAWTWLLAGQRLIGIVQSDNPDLEIGKIGSKEPGWNGKEWFDADRRGGKK